mgnify:CR=1 FL=1
MVDKCADCHKHHAESYRDSFHGKATKLGLGVAATCASCHTPHDMRHAKDPLSSVNPAHLKATCQQCHEGANDAFKAYAEANQIDLIVMSTHGRTGVQRLVMGSVAFMMFVSLRQR